MDNSFEKLNGQLESPLCPNTEEENIPEEKIPENVSIFQRLRRHIILEPYVILYMVSGYPTIPLHEQYFYYAVGLSMGVDTNNLTSSGNKSCGTEPNDTAYQQRELVQAKSAEISMYIQLATFLPTMISMLLYGTYSDKMGRKLLFILPPIAAIIDAVIHMAIIYFKLPLFVFYLSSIGSIFFGGYSLVFIALYSFIADTVPENKRATRMVIIDVLIKFLGGFTQLGIGYWIKQSYFWPYVFVIGGNVLAMLYAIFLIPETVVKTPTSRFKLTDVGKAFTLFFRDDGTRRRWKLQILLASLLLEMIFIAIGVFSLFEMNSPLCWNSVMIGYYGAASDTIRAFGGVTAFLKNYMEDHWLTVLGKLSFTLEMLYLAFVKTTLMMYFVPLIGFFEVLSMPVLRTMMSNCVNQNEQGAMFSAMTCFMYTIFLFSGTMSKKIYSATLYWWVGFVFLLSAFGGFLAIATLLLYIFLLKREKRIYGELLVNENAEEKSATEQN